MAATPADLLRSARERLNLSAREAAALAGIPGSTVSEAERGRDLRHDTLERLVAALPGLDGAALLGRPSCAPPALRGVWEFFAESFGFEARLMRLSSVVGADGRGPITLEVEGLRSRRLSLLDPNVRESLMQAAFEGSGAAMQSIEAGADDLSGVTRRIEDGDHAHEFVFPRDLARRGLTYRRVTRGLAASTPPWGEPFATGISAWIRYPVKRLELALARERDAPPLTLLPRAWPARVVVEPESAIETWDSLHARGPLGPAVLTTTEARLRIDCAMPAVCYGLEWTPATPQDVASLPPARSWRVAGPEVGRAAAPTAERLSAAREREGLSRRELARRMGVSPSTILETESGKRHLRLSTMRLLLEALPRLSPHALLLPRDGETSSTKHEAWRWHRDLAGASSDEEVTIIRIAPDGSCRYTCQVIGLRIDGRGGHALRLRHGLSATRAGLAAPKLLELHSDVPADALTTRVVQRETGALLHELRLGPELAGRRVSYQRTLIAGRNLPMTDEMSPMFLMASPLLPTRRLRLELRFGAGRLPSRHVAGCSPESMLVLKDGVEDLTERLHGAELRVTSDKKRGLLALTVDEPMLAVTYALGIWPVSG